MPRRAFRVLLLAAVGAYLLLLAGLFVFQRSLLYPAPEPRALGAVPDATKRTLDIPGGRVKAWWREIPGAPLLLFFHGNATQLANSVAIGRSVEAQGLGFAAVEYPGYGESTGVGPSEASLLEAARAVLDALAADGIGPPVCMGHSLGSGVAAAMAAEGRCARLVLSAPYTSIDRLAQHDYPFVPARWLVLDRFDTLARVPSIRVPTLVIHGSADNVIPDAMGKELASVIDGARFVGRTRAHNNLLDAETWDAVGAFARGE